jgi:hypothetical protein
MDLGELTATIAWVKKLHVPVTVFGPMPEYDSPLPGSSPFRLRGTSRVSLAGTASPVLDCWTWRCSTSLAAPGMCAMSLSTVRYAATTVVSNTLTRPRQFR